VASLDNEFYCNPSNCLLPDALTNSKALAEVHSLFSLFVVSHPGRPRSTTHANCSRPETDSSDTFDITAQDLCVPGYAKKVRSEKRRTLLVMVAIVINRQRKIYSKPR
jgi:hypothetical protein